MLEYVLIAEDHESANISIRKTLEDMGIKNVDFVYYCDAALSRIKTKPHGQPYDLLISDLGFEEDGSTQTISEGTELIKAVRAVQPDLKVLVFSAEHRSNIIQPLFDELNIDGYVRKARNDAQELRKALRAIMENKRHIPLHLIQEAKQNHSYDFSDFEITILSLLSQGTLQKDIPSYLQENGIKPSGLSTIEKTLNKMKDALGFTKNEQLVALCKDMGII